MVGLRFGLSICPHGSLRRCTKQEVCKENGALVSRMSPLRLFAMCGGDVGWHTAHTEAHLSLPETGRIYVGLAPVFVRELRRGAGNVHGSAKARHLQVNRIMEDKMTLQASCS